MDPSAVAQHDLDPIAARRPFRGLISLAKIGRYVPRPAAWRRGWLQTKKRRSLKRKVGGMTCDLADPAQTHAVVSSDLSLTSDQTGDC